MEDLKVPNRRRIGNKDVYTVYEVNDPLRPLYRLKIIEDDTENSFRVKVRYIRYSDQFGE